MTARNIFYGARGLYRLIGRLVPRLHLGWTAHLRTASWDGSQFRISGWAYSRGTGYETAPTVEVWLERRGTKTKITADVTNINNVDANARARRAEFDYSNTGFEARFDLATFGDAEPSRLAGRRSWVAKIRVTGNGRVITGPFNIVNLWGSPAVMQAKPISAETLAVPQWHGRHGLQIDYHEVDAVVDTVTLEGRDVCVRLAEPVERKFDRALLRGNGQIDALLTRSVQDPRRFDGRLPESLPVIDEITGEAHLPTWNMVSSGQPQGDLPAYVMGELDLREPGESGSIRASGDKSCQLQIIDSPYHLEVREVALEELPRRGIRVIGDYRDGGEPLKLVAVGRRLNVPLEITETSENSFSAFLPLDVSIWGGPNLPLVRGGYALAREVKDGLVPTTTNRELAATFARKWDLADFRLRFELSRNGSFRIVVARPRRDDELGSFNQQRLFSHYLDREDEPRDAVYFESFFGRNATCNPRAIDDEIAKRYPELLRYWGVSDLSVAVPEGAIPVVAGTKEWWDARASCRFIVTNEWLRTRFRKKKFQTVLQTWHGSMYKRIGLDREGMGKRHQKLLLAERANWDYFISQNAPSTEVIRSAYAFDDGILEIGYPRNDELRGADRDSIRRRLGIAPATTLVMYAPTWREERSGVVDFLDLDKLSNALNENFHTFLRGHVRTVAGSTAVAMERVTDVSTYPNVAELYVAADVLITDYSSMMFDYSVTGKPIVFFTPDIDDYTDARVRGAYFDLAELAPGPVVRTQSEVVTELESLARYQERFADKYETWKSMFNNHDDGHAAERAVDILLADLD